MGFCASATPLASALRVKAEMARAGMIE